MTGRSVLHSFRMGWWYGLWRLRPLGRALLARFGWAAYELLAFNLQNSCADLCQGLDLAIWLIPEEHGAR